MSPYCPIYSTVPHTFTTPTHLTRPPHTSTPSTTTAAPFGHHSLQLQQIPSPTNLHHSHTPLSHEPKIHSPPPPPSLSTQQVSQAIQSSSPALSPLPPPPTSSPRPHMPTANRTWSGAFAIAGFSSTISGSRCTTVSSSARLQQQTQCTDHSTRSKV